MKRRASKLLSRAKRALSGRPRSIAGAAGAQARGDAAREQGRWREAADNYEEHLLASPEDFDIWVQLGHAHKEQGDAVAAAAAYEHAAKLNPVNADLLLSRGHLAKREGDMSAATTFYRASFEIDRNADAGRELISLGCRPFLADADGQLAQEDRLSPVAAAFPEGFLDSVQGWRAVGWVVDPEAKDDPPEVVFFQDGRLIGKATVEFFRPDVAMQGIGNPMAGFEAVLDLDFSASETVEVTARLKRTGQLLGNSPVVATAPAEHRAWLLRNDGLAGDELALVKSLANTGLAGRLSIVMPVYNTRHGWLRDAIQSVLDQWCDAWELICVDDCSPDPEVRRILTDFAEQDERVKPIFLERNLGIAGATNRGIAAASGEYIGFLDHDDHLEPEAVGRMLQAASGGAELLYSDEAVTEEYINAVGEFRARPAFSYDYYLSHPYFVHFIVVRADVARGLGGWDEDMSISADVDFVVRVVERATKVTHVPAVLYRWRTHRDSTGHAKKAAVMEATGGSIARHLKRTGQNATVDIKGRFNTFRISYADDPQPTAVIIPTKNRRDLLEVAISSVKRTTDAANVHIVVIDHESDDPDFLDYIKELGSSIQVIRYTGPFNYAKMNNEAVSKLDNTYKYLLFMNNDVEAIQPGWLEHMRGLCAREDVGIVGSTLLYPDDTIQHSGVVMGLSGSVDHAHKFQPFNDGLGERNYGYNASLVSTRDYSVVTAACLMVPTVLFRAVGGFDETFEIGFNDVDFCLRVAAKGYTVLSDAHAVLYHHESATRRRDRKMDHPEDSERLHRRWSALMKGHDPFYNPMLSMIPASDHRVVHPERAHASPRTRTVTFGRLIEAERSAAVSAVDAVADAADR